MSTSKQAQSTKLKLSEFLAKHSLQKVKREQESIKQYLELAYSSLNKQEFIKLTQELLKHVSSNYSLMLFVLSYSEQLQAKYSIKSLRESYLESFFSNYGDIHEELKQALGDKYKELVELYDIAREIFRKHKLRLISFTRKIEE